MSNDDGELATPPPPEQPEQPERSDTPDIPWGLLSFLVGVVLLTVFVLQNTQEVDLQFLGWEWTPPLSFILVFVTVVTIVLDEFLGYVLRRRRRRRRADREELKRLRSNE